MKLPRSLTTHVSLELTILPDGNISVRITCKHRLELPISSSRSESIIQEAERPMTDGELAARLHFLAKKLNILIQRDPTLYLMHLQASDIMEPDGHLMGPDRKYHAADVDIMAVLDEMSFIERIISHVPFTVNVPEIPYNLANRAARMKGCIHAYHVRHQTREQWISDADVHRYRCIDGSELRV